jgi:hypothetical protein
MTHKVAEEILQQLGGARFRVMTGANRFVGSANSLSFQLPPGSRDRINGVYIVREHSLHTVEFLRVQMSPYRRHVVRKAEAVCAEDLPLLFTEVTGLEVDLGANVVLIEHDDGDDLGPAP